MNSGNNLTTSESDANNFSAILQGFNSTALSNFTFTTMAYVFFTQTVLGTLLQDIRTFYIVYILPFVIIIGVLENIAVLFVFGWHSGGVSQTTRIYYIILAILDIISLLTYHLPQYTTWGLWFITNGKFSILIDASSDFVCALFNYLFYLSEGLANYYYLLFTIERLVAIRSPLLLKKYFSRSHSIAAILIIFTLLASAYLVIFWSYAIWYALCYPKIFEFFLMIILTGAIIPNSHLIPTVANAFMNVWLLISIRLAFKRRAELTSGRTELAAVKTKELSISITIAVVQIIHLLLFLPSGLLMFLSTLYLLNKWYIFYPESYNIIYQWSFTALFLTSVGHCVNFLIYMSRMPGFRKRIFKPLLALTYMSSKFSSSTRPEANLSGQAPKKKSIN